MWINGLWYAAVYTWIECVVKQYLTSLFVFFDLTLSGPKKIVFFISRLCEYLTNYVSDWAENWSKWKFKTFRVFLINFSAVAGAWQSQAPAEKLDVFLVKKTIPTLRIARYKDS